MKSVSILAGVLVAVGGSTAPAPADASAEPPRLRTITLSTGVRLQYAEQGAPEGEPVILLHGYTDSWFSYSRVLPLVPDRYRVYALTLRGHGDSDRPASGYQMRDLASDVIAFMDAKGIVRASIVGHSMGGLVAQQVALAAPRRTSRLVLVATAAAVQDFAAVRDFERAVNTLPDPVPVEFAREFQYSTVHHPVPDAFMRTAIAESLKLPAVVWRQLMAGMMAADPAVALGRSGIPALVLRGDKDTLIDAAAQDSLVAMLGTATGKTYLETGHALHWERPEEFARDLVAFLDAGGERAAK